MAPCKRIGRWRAIPYRLPADIQLAAIHTIPGLTRARVLQIGYAVEYDSVDATQLYPTFECKKVPGLYFAGQVCGTSGYEEAAGQGLLAGINAALKIKGDEVKIFCFWSLCACPRSM